VAQAFFRSLYPKDVSGKSFPDDFSLDSEFFQYKTIWPTRMALHTAAKK
jgi:hypothetical protein